MLTENKYELNRKVSALRHAGPWIADSPNMQSGVAVLNIRATFANEHDELDAAQADELAARLITDPALQFSGISMFNRTPFRRYTGTAITPAADLLEASQVTLDAAVRLGPRPSPRRNARGDLEVPVATARQEGIVRDWVATEDGAEYRIGNIPQLADARSALWRIAELTEELEAA